MKRSKKPVPVYIVDEHNEALFFWHKARYESFLKEPLDLFHIDAHDDMVRPDTFKKSLYAPGGSVIEKLDYYRLFVETELHNGNFILPAVLAGLVRNVYFIYPGWRHFKPRRRRSNVSSVFGEGKMLKYGMKAAENMQERSKKVLPDLTSYTSFQYDIQGIPQGKKVILDIDLDYFACRDSIYNKFRYEIAIMPEQFRKREEFLADKTLSQARLYFEFMERDDGYYVQVGHKPVKEVSHLPSQDEITTEIDTLLSTLQRNRIKPQVVTIARSNISGYCPVEYVEGIEKELVNKLEQVFSTQMNEE